MLIIKRTSTGEPEPEGDSQLASMSMKYDKLFEALLWQVPLVKLKNSEEKNTAEGTMMLLGPALKMLEELPRGYLIMISVSSGTRFFISSNRRCHSVSHFSKGEANILSLVFSPLLSI